MTVAVPNIDNAPRSIEELTQLSPYGIRRLAEAISAKDHMFYGATEGEVAAGRSAFMAADKHSQATRIFHWLTMHDNPTPAAAAVHIVPISDPVPVQLPLDTVQDSPSAKREPKTRRRATPAAPAVVPVVVESKPQEVPQGITLEQLNKLTSDLHELTETVCALSRTQAETERKLNLVLGLSGYLLEFLTGDLKDMLHSRIPNINHLLAMLKNPPSK